MSHAVVFAGGLAAGLYANYAKVSLIPDSVEAFLYKYFTNSGRRLVEEDKRADKKSTYNKAYSIHRGVANDRRPD